MVATSRSASEVGLHAGRMVCHDSAAPPRGWMAWLNDTWQEDVVPRSDVDWKAAAQASEEL